MACVTSSHDRFVAYQDEYIMNCNAIILTTPNNNNNNNNNNNDLRVHHPRSLIAYSIKTKSMYLVRSQGTNFKR